jgi:anaphase-promoting complex subunit 1
MAAIKSLGLHTPSALAHLIAESLLPPDPASNLYTWETYVNGSVEEEILFTSKCVAWSQGRVIRKLFSFDAEDETVQHALLTWFPAHEAQDDVSRRDYVPATTVGQSGNQTRELLATSVSAKNSKPSTAPARALVVLLQYQAHIFFLSGASHLVKLPFEVERAFPAPKGIILQRKLSPVVNPDSQSTLGQPNVPQNSFQSPISSKSFQSMHTSMPLPKSQRHGKDYNSKLDFGLLETLSTPNDESIPRHFSLTSPLSEFSLVVRTPSGNPDFWTASAKATKSLEALESSEELLYISPSDESPPIGSSDAAPLFLAVTVDREKGVYSIWNASYLDSKPISKIITGGSTPTTGVKNRRRSSFVATTGTATPAIRSRDIPRESVGMTTSKTMGKKKSSKRGTTSLKEAEDTLASQIDPEFEPRRTARESRRVSSMISRADLNPSFDRSAFQDLASQHGGTGTSHAQHGRRGHSLGNAPEKISFATASQRRLRASTPGAFSRLSIEDISDIGGGTPLGLNGSQASTTFEDHEMLADLTANNDDLDGFDLQAPLDGLKKEVLVRKFAEISIQIGSSRESKVNSTTQNIDAIPVHQRMKVFTMLSPINCEESGPYGRRFFLYIFNHITNECIQVEFSVRHKNSPSSTEGSQDHQHSIRRAVPMPSLRSVSRLSGRFNDIVDVIKTSDGFQSRMLLLRSGRSGQSSVWVFSPWSPETPMKVPLHRLRVFNPYDITSSSNPIPRGVGSRRSFDVPRQIIRLANTGPNGLFDIISTDNRPHRLVVQLWPRSSSISKIMELFLFALPLSIAEKILSMWWNRHNNLQNTLQKEWHALAISLFALFLSCEGDKRKRRPRKNTDLASADNRTNLMQKLDTSWNSSSTQSIPAWLWATKLNKSMAPMEGSPPHQRIGMVKSPNKLSKIGVLKNHVTAAREFIKSGEAKEAIDSLRTQRQVVLQVLPRLMAVLHLIREEMKLDSTTRDIGSPEVSILAPIIAQLGRWLDWPDWDWKESRYYHYELSEAYDFEDG